MKTLDSTTRNGSVVRELEDVHPCICTVIPMLPGSSIPQPEILGIALVEALQKRAQAAARGTYARQSTRIFGYDSRSKAVDHPCLEWSTVDNCGCNSDFGRGKEALHSFMHRMVVEAKPPHKDGPNVFMFVSAAYLVRECPKFTTLISRACRTGVACGGTSDGTLYAVAVATHLYEQYKDNLAELLRQLSSTASPHPLGRNCSYPGWELIETSGPLHSPAMNGISNRTAATPFDAPVFLNTALAEVILKPAYLVSSKTDARQLVAALQKQRDLSAVSWIFNELLNVLEHRNGSVLPLSVPPEVHIAVSATCNIECQFCSYSHASARKDQVSVQQVMKLDFFSKIRTLRLHSGNGEPTVNKNLAEIIRYVSKAYPQIAMNFFTNGVLLDRNGLIESLVASQVGWISVSLNAATPEMWQKLCGANHFERIKRNLILLLEEKRAKKSCTPVVYGSMVLTRASVYELPKMPELCRLLGVDRFTAIPFFSLGYEDANRLGPDDAYHHVGADYDEIYESAVNQAQRWNVSIELPSKSDAKGASFGVESRDFHDFANVKLYDSRLEVLLGSSLDFNPLGSPCPYLWKQAAIGVTEKKSDPGGHFLYPCLGPLATVNFASRTKFDFPDEDGFMTLWRNSLFTHLRSGQSDVGKVPVCDKCRGCDTRSPDSLAPMKVMIDDFIQAHGLG